MAQLFETLCMMLAFKESHSLAMHYCRLVWDVRSLSLLIKKSAWVVYTIDSPSWFVKLFRRSIEWRIIKDVILQFCGIKNVRRLMFANVKNSTLNQRQRWLEYLYQEASKLCG